MFDLLLLVYELQFRNVNQNNKSNVLTFKKNDNQAQLQDFKHWNQHNLQHTLANILLIVVAQINQLHFGQLIFPHTQLIAQSITCPWNTQ